ncbi:MAG TPA: PadR family transcriptional regulator [Gemmatimonadaceae bacterium]
MAIDPPLAGLELTTLLAVVRLGDTAYGAEIRRAVSDAVGHPYSVGAIYTTLQRLAEKGLLKSWASEPRAERGGRSRRYFAATSRGLAAGRAARSHYEQMWKGLTLSPRST